MLIALGAEWARPTLVVTSATYTPATPVASWRTIPPRSSICPIMVIATAGWAMGKIARAARSHQSWVATAGNAQMFSVTLTTARSMGEPASVVLDMGGFPP